MRGKLTIVTMLFVAVVLAAIAWWQAWNRGHRVLSLWGSQAAYLIRTAHRVDLYQKVTDDSVGHAMVDPPPDSGQRQPAVDIQSLEGQTVRHRDISDARGLVHARQALIEDASYDWQTPVPASQSWQYALRFSSDQKVFTLWFDLNTGVVWQRKGHRRASIEPIAEGLREFFKEQFPAQRGQRRAGEGRGVAAVRDPSPRLSDHR